MEFTNDNIKGMTSKLNPNKPHGHEMTSICMLKMSGDAIIEPFFTIFKNCLKRGIFPDDWKNGNIEPIFKKGNKVLIMDKSEYKKEMYIEKYSLDK